jgi:hypothetical protein
MDKPKMDDIKSVPYVVYEGEQVINERKEFRLIIVVIIMILLTFATNALWLYAWMQYDYTSEQSVSIDSTDGVANYIGKDGAITYGEDTGN